MRIDLKAIGSKARSLFSLQPILGLTTVALLVIINWDILVLRYHAFLEWAAWVPQALAQVFTFLFAVAMATLLQRAIGVLLELVYFGPLKRLIALEKKANEQLVELQERSWCHGHLLNILAEEMTDSQFLALVELDKKVSKHPEWAGARKAFREFCEHEHLSTRLSMDPKSTSTRAG